MSFCGDGVLSQTQRKLKHELMSRIGQGFDKTDHAVCGGMYNTLKIESRKGIGHFMGHFSRFKE